MSSAGMIAAKKRVRAQSAAQSSSSSGSSARKLASKPKKRGLVGGGGRDAKSSNKKAKQVNEGEADAESSSDASMSGSDSDSDSDDGVNEIVMEEEPEEEDREGLHMTKLLAAGTVLCGRVDTTDVVKSPYVELKVLPWLYVRLCLTEVADAAEWQSHPFKGIKPGSFLRCAVLQHVEKSRDKKMVDVTIRPDVLSRVTVGALGGPDGALPADALAEELALAQAYPAVGELVKGFVEAVNKVGAFVRISRGVRALCPIKHLADRFVEDPAKEFPVGKLVAGRVLFSSAEDRKLVLSLRSSAVLGNGAEARAARGNADWAARAAAVRVGTAVGGTVSNVAAYGVFVRLDVGGAGDASNSNLSGLCHRTELADEPVHDHQSAYATGDRVRVYVLSVDTEKKRISISMKPSLLDGAAAASDDDEGEMKEGEQGESDGDADEDEGEEGDDSSDDEVVEKLRPRKGQKVLEAVSPSDDESEDDDGEENGEDEDEDEDESGDGSSDEGEEEEEEEGTAEGQGLSLQEALAKRKARQSAGSSWQMVDVGDADAGADADADAGEASGDAGSDSDADADAGDAKEGRGSKKKQSKRRAQQRRLEEAEIAAREQALLDDDQSPKSVDDFERLLMASPNSSMLWIQYMAFQTAQMEMDLARTVAERALSKINYRLEKEKRNVLLSLFRLECRHGDAASAASVTARVLEMCDRDEAYLDIAKVRQELGELDKADDALKLAVKASKGESELPWVRRIELLFERGQPQEAQALLRQAQRNVVRQKRPQLYMAYARMEFSRQEQGGEPERARTILEGLVDEFPKRNDLWNQFIDLELKFGKDAAKVRHLFERVTATKLSVKKIKTFFKKWLVYETEHGTDENQEYVKAKARAYVEAITNE